MFLGFCGIFEEVRWKGIGGDFEGILRNKRKKIIGGAYVGEIDFMFT